MRTSLNEIAMIETYLHGKMCGRERLLFEVRMLIDRSLRKNVWSQRQVYALVKLHQQELLRSEFQKAHDHLWDDPALLHVRKQVENLF